MTNKSIIPRGLVRSDVEAAVDYYVLEAGTEVALGFIDALEAAYDLIARHPESESLRYGYELGLPDLRRNDTPPISSFIVIKKIMLMCGVCFMGNGTFHSRCRSLRIIDY